MSLRKVDNGLLEPLVERGCRWLLPFIPSGVTANVISVVGLVAALAAGVVLATAGVDGAGAYRAGAGLVLVRSLTDSLDGVVARARGQVSLLGYYLDHYGDALSTVAIAVGMFAGGGSHVVIGLCVAVMYLLLMISGHVKAEVLGVMEIPRIGPTEVSLLAVALLIAQGELMGRDARAWLPESLFDLGLGAGLGGALTFLDVCGLLALALAPIGVVLDFASTARRLHGGSAGPR